VNKANIAMLESAAADIEEMLTEVAFVGGATIELWISDPAAPEFRPTKDIDVIVEITTRTAYYRLEQRLRELGFQNEQDDGVICRFRHSDTAVILDVMPTETSILGFDNRWLKESFPHAVPRELRSGREIRVVPPVYLMATKLEAFASRGKGDLHGSKDFEDMLRLLDGREELVGELSDADADIKAFVATRMADLARHATFDSAAEGALGGGPETLDRYEQVLRPRVEAVIALGG
jgi:Nucleotidyl transferase AbiEii toxin, Type IV TA system